MRHAVLNLTCSSSMCNLSSLVDPEVIVRKSSSTTLPMLIIMQMYYRAYCVEVDHRAPRVVEYSQTTEKYIHSSPSQATSLRIVFDSSEINIIVRAVNVRRCLGSGKSSRERQNGSKSLLDPRQKMILQSHSSPRKEISSRHQKGDQDICSRLSLSLTL